jgi:chromosome segregation ATPase
MKTGNEARKIQVLSLTDQIKGLQGDIARIKQEKSDWDSGKKDRDAQLEAENKAIFAAKESHTALCKSQDAEIEAKQQEIARLRNQASDMMEWYSHEAAERSVTLMGHDETIRERESKIAELESRVHDLQLEVSRLSGDRVLALKSTSDALEENRRAVKKLADTEALIAQSEKDHAAGETKRKKDAKSLQSWQERLDTRENDLNVLSARLKPEFIKVFGEHKIHQKVFEPSKQ